MSKFVGQAVEILAEKLSKPTAAVVNTALFLFNSNQSVDSGKAVNMMQLWKELHVIDIYQRFLLKLNFFL